MKRGFLKPQEPLNMPLQVDIETSKNQALQISLGTLVPNSRVWHEINLELNILHLKTHLKVCFT